MIWNLGALDPRFLTALGILYAAASLVTFLIYGFDKWAAIKGWRRVREDTLHLLAVIGGWPGALMGQKLFRHKTVKASFRRVFWATFVLNIAAVLWLMSVNGQAALAQLAGL